MVYGRYAVASAVVALAGCASGGAADRSAEIASAIGASSCEATTYQIEYRLDGNRVRIYDCWITGDEACVTEDSGIVRNVTAFARELFRDEIAGGKPSCAS